MPQYVEVNGEVVEFPDNMSDDQIAQAIRGESAPAATAAQPSVAAALAPKPRGIQPTSPGEYARYLGGLGENVLSMGTGLASMIPAGLMGIVAAAIPGGQTGAEKVQEVQSALTYQPRLPEGQAIAQGLSRPAQAIDTGLTDVFDTGNPLLSATLRTGAEGLALLAPAAKSFKAARGTPRQPGPTTSELFKAGRDSFNRARQLGGNLSADAGERLIGNVTGLQNEVGLPIRINPKLHPKSAALVDEIAKTMRKDVVSFDDLIELRQIAGDVAGAVEKDDAFRGLLIKNQIDDFVNSINPADMTGGNPAAAAAALNQARSTWAAASKAATIEERIALAGDRAGQFSGSGFENALRTEFRQLKRRITKGQERGFTPEEVALIDAVVNGDSVQKALTLLGKLAPTGVLPFGISSGAGYAIGGPVGAAALPTIGGLSRLAATNRRINSAQAALEAVQNRGMLAP